MNLDQLVEDVEKISTLKVEHNFKTSRDLCDGTIKELFFNSGNPVVSINSNFFRNIPSLNPDMLEKYLTYTFRLLDEYAQIHSLSQSFDHNNEWSLPSILQQLQQIFPGHQALGLAKIPFQRRRHDQTIVDVTNRYGVNGLHAYAENEYEGESLVATIISEINGVPTYELPYYILAQNYVQNQVCSFDWDWEAQRKQQKSSLNLINSTYDKVIDSIISQANEARTQMFEGFAKRQTNDSEIDFDFLLGIKTEVDLHAYLIRQYITKLPSLLKNTDYNIISSILSCSKINLLIPYEQFETKVRTAVREIKKIMEDPILSKYGTEKERLLQILKDINANVIDNAVDFCSRLRTAIKNDYCINLEEAVAHANIIVPDIELGPELGSGVSATVYMGKRPVFEDDIAVKIFSDSGNEDEARKLNSLGAMNCRYIVRVINAGNIAKIGGKPHFTIVMEYVKGKTINEYLKHEGTFSIGAVLRYSSQIFEAIKIMRDSHIYHRDLRPQNIIIGVDNNIKVIDFGISTYSLLVTDKNRRYSCPMDQPHTLDTFALGLIIYKMTTGKHMLDMGWTSLAEDSYANLIAMQKESMITNGTINPLYVKKYMQLRPPLPQLIENLLLGNIAGADEIYERVGIKN